MQETVDRENDRTGRVTAVRGSVVDARFDDGLPLINNLLSTEGDAPFLMEVLAHVDGNTVRGVALTPPQGLSRGVQLHDTGAQLQA
ncbi:MAG TPA: F0F1 ATP synthase subunit beta, partial [Candidatus Ozemobacteraceae bacterium]|nr:F0F1 ATP synthase subunit beta [Candidatus Ozemobacteraceae bacterium]